MPVEGRLEQRIEIAVKLVGRLVGPGVRARLDARSRKSYLAKALSLASAELVAASLVASAGGRLALPALWALALAAASVVLLSRSLRGGGSRRRGRG